jgi:integrase
MMSSLRRGLGHLLQRDLKELDRVALIDAIERIERNGKPGAARDFRKHLRTFINRQLSVGVISVDPLAGYRMPAATKDDVIEAEEHGQSLNEPEILAIWRAATSIGGPFGGLVQMGLLSGLRRGELAALRWDWIDRGGLKITVPGKVMKNGRVHTVPDHLPDREAARRNARPRWGTRLSERSSPRRRDANVGLVEDDDPPAAGVWRQGRGLA